VYLSLSGLWTYTTSWDTTFESGQSLNYNPFFTSEATGKK
jgi:hypothetical protein